MKQNIYAIIQTKDGAEYLKGELVEVSLWRRNLMINKRKWQKVVKLEVKVK